MFQTFSVATIPDTGPTRLAAVRAAMAEAGVDAFLVPRADAHQGEFVAPRDARLPWLTGFTGSAGMAVVTADAAAIFVDGRYTLQVRAQVDTSAFEPRSLPADKPSDWLVGQLSAGQVVGFDPWLHTRKSTEELREALAAKDIALRSIANPVDAAWVDQPDPPRGRASVHPDALAGRSSEEKREDLGRELREARRRAHVLSLPDSIAWLLNIRGSDIPHMPVVHAFAILNADASVDLFTDKAKIGPEVRAHLGRDVRVLPPGDFDTVLAVLDGPVGLDPDSAPVWVAERLDEAGTEIEWTRDPCILPKATKTEAELRGARAAHVRDGAAMVEFLHWLDDTAPGGGLTEIDVVRELESRRRATNALKDISFETICGAGPNGAIVHYRVSEETNRAVRPGELLLIDSGGQYEDGTTDITRTVAVGEVDPAARRAFTLVLKGMIAISRARWPEGLAGRDIDPLARQALWMQGFDYDHGTGHGVGAYLGVHEGPQNLSRRGLEPLKPGMILSNEPGYYREGAFGIRIENLVAVTPASVPEGGEREVLGFETLTLAPIDTRLVDADSLTGDERDWLNAYHRTVKDTLTPLVSQAAADWLERATRPV